ncbi:MAG: PD40 domain-containing protein, partial [Planctomycetaceae bacterium]|nr:PD40 domain-containing protein [Planctomycetaceae bacterium]
MKHASSALLLAVALGGCAPSAGVELLSSDDLEPALTQETMGRAGADRDPDVSKDGSLLFYASSSHDEAFSLYVKKVGSNTSTRIGTPGGDRRFPRVSPTQPRRLAYCSNEHGRWELVLADDYIGQPGKTEILSEPGTENLHPSWSPDGKKLVYCSTHSFASGEWSLRIRDLESGRTTVLEDVDGLLPEWSPVGNRIVFQRMKHRDDWLSSLWTLDYDAGEARRVTSIFSSDDWAAINPTWSPDGRKVAFATVGKSRLKAGVMNQADDVWVVAA